MRLWRRQYASRFDGEEPGLPGYQVSGDFGPVQTVLALFGGIGTLSRIRDAYCMTGCK